MEIKILPVTRRKPASKNRSGASIQGQANGSDEALRPAPSAARRLRADAGIIAPRRLLSGRELCEGIANFRSAPPLRARPVCARLAWAGGPGGLFNRRKDSSPASLPKTNSSILTAGPRQDGGEVFVEETSFAPQGAIAVSQLLYSEATALKCLFHQEKGTLRSATKGM
jgi:hypothetical protein